MKSQRRPAAANPGSGRHGLTANSGFSDRTGRLDRTYGAERMTSILKSAGIALTPEQIRQLWRYHELLREYNTDLNLTRIHSFDNMVQKLYVDSILPGTLMALPSPLMDVGTGAGMPGIPLKIAFPELEIWLAESRQKRVVFLEMVVSELGLTGLRVVGKGISESFQEPVAGVITRAVETLSPTLERVRGCLCGNGLAIFMKGPRGSNEIDEALRRWGREYRLLENREYSIPHTPFDRRLIVFQRVRESLAEGRERAMRAYQLKKIDSEQNDNFKDLKKLLQSRGIRKEGKAIVSGRKQVEEALRDFPHRCLGWISSGENDPPPEILSSSFIWYQLARPLFKELDIFGADSPLLLMEASPLPLWNSSEELPLGCTLMVPFQDPENVGAVIRSAVAFGVSQIILLAESAHPYHPKALRASGGAVLRARLFLGPSIQDLPADLPMVSLSAEGDNISNRTFPDRFALLPGIEGPGLPDRWRAHAVSIPLRGGVESLNAAAATAIALYLWAHAQKL
jgi:16S rRNA (guanine(527)-N(7))-methyltransferase RsmG